MKIHSNCTSLAIDSLLKKILNCFSLYKWKQKLNFSSKIFLGTNFKPEKPLFSEDDVIDNDSKNKVSVTESSPEGNKAALMAVWTICGVLFVIIVVAVLQCRNISKKMKRELKESIYKFILT